MKVDESGRLGKENSKENIWAKHCGTNEDCRSKGSKMTESCV